MGVPIGNEEMAEKGVAAWRLAVDSPEPISNLKLKFKDHHFGVILHQVRHPLDVIRSMHTARPASWDYIERFIPIQKSDSLTIKCLKCWYYWNWEAAQISSWRYRIEDLPDVFDVFCDQILCSELKAKRSVLDELKRDINTRKEQYGAIREITWEVLEEEDHHLCLKIKDLAKEYGYAL